MKILLAVSGGVDSVYLLHRSSEFFPGSEIEVAHCNFGLRGEESDADQDFVALLCRKASLRLHLKRFDTRSYSSQKGISIEMAARELRYGWFTSLCREESFDALAVAHNANDNAETLILNLLRGSGTKGLRGMAAESISAEGMKILRPMLQTSRGEIIDWMSSRGYEWREDSSNRDNSYKRNLIRNEIFPLFAKINPSFVRTLGKDMQYLAQSEAIADDYFKENTGRIMSRKGEIRIAPLLSLPHWQYMLFRLLEGSGINSEQFENLLQALQKEESTLAGKTFGPVKAGSGILRVGIEEKRPEYKIEFLDRKEISELKQKAGVIIMDAGKLPVPLVIREWKPGDWMRPLGMGGRKKKLSDIFTDLKWSRDKKSKALVVELEGSHTGALLWERIDEGVRVNDDTLKIVRITRLHTDKASGQEPGA